MAGKRKVQGNQFPFSEFLRLFYMDNKGKIRRYYKDLSRKFLDYNDKTKRADAYLRKPQFEALEMYVFLKEFLDNRQMYEIFEDWRNRQGKFADGTYYPTSARNGQTTLYDTTAREHEVFFQELKKYHTSYPNYIFSLAMGLGKTLLMATCIYYEFLLANKFPRDPRFCHNVLIFAPDLTVLQSLREILSIDKTFILPPEYVRVLDANIKYHFLDENATLNTLDTSDFNVIISNTQKIVVKKKNVPISAGEKLFTQKTLVNTSILDDAITFIYGEDVTQDNLILNQRFMKLSRLPQLGIYVDEAHHLFGAKLEKSLRDKTRKSDQTNTSLRNTINLLSEYREQERKGTTIGSYQSGILACYNFTGTPYVENSVLPEVVYSYGLKEAIDNEYLKRAYIIGYEEVKDIQFLKEVITSFWENYGGKTYDGLNPKLAIFGSQIEEVRNKIKPDVETILSELNIPLSKILVNVGDKDTTDADIGLFNNLDQAGTEGNEKQFLLLVNKGREGWNCKSLFGVALYRELRGAAKVFVLQATMRCLRKITDEQQTAQIFLSKENYDILNEELMSNFRLQISDLSNKNKIQKESYQVRVRPPLRKIKVNVIRYIYSCTERENPEFLSLHLKDHDLSRYEAKVYTKELGSRTTVKEQVLDDIQEERKYTRFRLIGEISRYLNIKPTRISEILVTSKDGFDTILDLVNKHNDIVYDILIPEIFHLLYKITTQKITEAKTLVLLKEPKNAEYYTFSAKPDLVVKESDSDVKKYAKKSFHADTYCFDSKPELECFWQYLQSSKVQKIYFTGMFTSNQGDFSIPYIDPETKKLRHYYPDFLAQMEDGSYQIIEVKGDNKIDDAVVLEKKSAAEDLATESKMQYIIYKGSEIIKYNVLEDEVQLNL